jgi:hypothetical protein
MSGLWIWLAAAAAYVAFRAWYDNWRGPLRPEEIDTYLKRIEAAQGVEGTDIETMRRFLEEDDGREFMMLNLVRLNPELAPHPETGEPIPAPSFFAAHPFKAAALTHLAVRSLA